MKIGIISNGGLNAPHVRIYADFFDKNDIDYDIISWDADGDPNNKFNFSYRRNFSESALSRLIPYIRFSNFCARIIKKYQYNKLVVISPSVALFIPFMLRKHYKNEYIFDYRDLSIEQMAFFKPILKLVLKYSYANVISSPGFRTYLPGKFDYVLSHNFNIELVRTAIDINYKKTNPDVLKILTIGSIRIDGNYEVIDAVGNVEGIQLDFVGKSGSGAAKLLETYANEKRYKNITFKGEYQKEDEKNIYMQYDIVNIYYPKIPSHISALSNRFYNSLICKKPMLVTKGGVQGDYVEKYGLGLAIDDCTDLPQKLKEFYKTLDFESYQDRCNNLLRSFLRDYDAFESVLRIFVTE